MKTDTMTRDRIKSEIEDREWLEKLKFFENTCKKRGLKLTQQRIEIYRQVFLLTLDHPSAIKVYEKLREHYNHISLDTVNRNLLEFRKIGVVEVVEGSGSPKRFETNFSLHHHFRCLKCNELIDIYNEDFNKVEISKELVGHFNILRKRVYLEGYCHKCKKTKK